MKRGGGADTGVLTDTCSNDVVAWQTRVVVLTRMVLRGCMLPDTEIFLTRAIMPLFDK